MPGHLDVIEIPSTDPITVALGGNNDIVIAQLHEMDEGRASISTSSIQTQSPRRSSRWRRTSVEGDADVEIEALRNRIAQLAAEGREQEREAACGQLAELTMRGPAGFKPGRRLPERPIPRLRFIRPTRRRKQSGPPT